jgi:hypothetical protein
MGNTKSVVEATEVVDTKHDTDEPFTEKRDRAREFLREYLVDMADIQTNEKLKGIWQEFMAESEQIFDKPISALPIIDKEFARGTPVMDRIRNKVSNFGSNEAVVALDIHGRMSPVFCLFACTLISSVNKTIATVANMEAFVGNDDLGYVPKKKEIEEVTARARKVPLVVFADDLKLVNNHREWKMLLVAFAGVAFGGDIVVKFSELAKIGADEVKEFKKELNDVLHTIRKNACASGANNEPPAFIELFARMTNSKTDYDVNKTKQKAIYRVSHELVIVQAEVDWTDGARELTIDFHTVGNQFNDADLKLGFRNNAVETKHPLDADRRRENLSEPTVVDMAVVEHDFSVVAAHCDLDHTKTNYVGCAYSFDEAQHRVEFGNAVLMLNGDGTVSFSKTKDQIVEMGTVRGYMHDPLRNAKGVEIGKTLMNTQKTHMWHLLYTKSKTGKNYAMLVFIVTVGDKSETLKFDSVFDCMAHQESSSDYIPESVRAAVKFSLPKPDNSLGVPLPSKQYLVLTNTSSSPITVGSLKNQKRVLPNQTIDIYPNAST